MINSDLENFINKKTTKQKIIVIYWPTWCWKTKKSIEIAKSINSEIIGSDSRQIYKYLDIWTWKVTEDEKQWIIHHMIDIIEPNQKYSVWQYKTDVESIINTIHNKWKIPLLVWWTWLYIDSIIYDFKIPKACEDIDLRNKLEEEASIYGKEFVYEKLVKIDPIYAKQLHPNNTRYVIRGIEIKTLTWHSKLDFREEKTLKYDTYFVNPYDWNRKVLYENIDKRIEEMFENYLIDEVKNILNMWYNKDDFWLKSIWYKEVIDYLDSKIDLKTCIELVKKNNRNYAKRQLTWFRNYEK